MFQASFSYTSSCPKVKQASKQLQENLQVHRKASGELSIWKTAHFSNGKELPSNPMAALLAHTQEKKTHTCTTA